jgi:hypothetical protein
MSIETFTEKYERLDPYNKELSRSILKQLSLPGCETKKVYDQNTPIVITDNYEIACLWKSKNKPASSVPKSILLFHTEKSKKFEVTKYDDQFYMEWDDNKKGIKNTDSKPIKKQKQSPTNSQYKYVLWGFDSDISLEKGNDAYTEEIVRKLKKKQINQEKKPILKKKTIQEDEESEEDE